MLKSYEVLFIAGLFLMVLGLISLVGPIYVTFFMSHRATHSNIEWIVGLGGFLGGILMVILAMIIARRRGDL